MIEKLGFLIALSREHHFGRAAELCGVTQPTLSAGIKQLEADLGVLLVMRGSRFQGFTAEGERVLEWGRRIVADARAMRQEVDTLKRGLRGHLTISVIPTALSMVAQLTTPFRARHPDVTFTILSRTSIDVQKELDDLGIDAGITYLDNEPLGRVSEVGLYTETYCLLIAADSPLALRPSIRWAELADVPLCLLTQDMQNRRIIERALTGAGVAVWPTLVSNSMQVLLSHVSTGRWSSIMPEILVESLGVGDTVRAVPIVEPRLSHAVGLITRQRETQTPLIRALIAEARRFVRPRGP